MAETTVDEAPEVAESSNDRLAAADDGVADGGVADGGVARGIGGVTLAVLAAGAPLVGASGVGVGWTLLLGSAALAFALAPSVGPLHRGSAAGLMPMAFCLLVAAVVLVGTVAAVVRVSVWRERWQAELLWAAAMVVVALVCVRRRGRVPLWRGEPGGAVALGALWFLGVLAATFTPFTIWSRHVAGGTDFGRHVVFMKDTLGEGFLSYAYLDYPRGVHALIATVWNASGGSTYADAWRATESVLWLMITLMFTAAVFAAIRVADRLRLPSWLGQWGVTAITLLVLLQGMWITAVFSGGFLTSIFGGLVLAVLCAQGFLPEWVGTRGSVLFASIAVMLLAQSWALLAPIAAAAACVALVVWLVRTRPGWRGWLVPVVVAAGAAALCYGPVNDMLIRRAADGELGSDLGTFGESGLTPPAWPWAIAVALALLCIVVAWRARLRRAVVWWASMAVMSVGLTLGLVVVSGSTWGQMAYYPAKTLWTCTVLVVPLAVTGAVWLVVTTFRAAARLTHRLARTVALALVAAAVVGVLAGISGWMSGYPSAALIGVQHGLGAAPLQIPVVQELEARGISSDSDRQVLVWGLAPYGAAGSMAAMAGMPDWFAREATTWRGMKGISGDAMISALYTRNSATACDFFRYNPDALRITGPNPATGAQWLLDSGCPADVVKAEEWVVVPIDKEWFADLPMYDVDYYYPTYQQYRDFRAGKQPVAS